MLNTIPTVGDETRELAKFAADKLGKTAAIIYEKRGCRHRRQG